MNKNQLQQIIKEELKAVLNEINFDEIGRLKRDLVGRKFHGYVIEDVALVKGKPVVYFYDDEGNFVWNFLPKEELQSVINEEEVLEVGGYRPDTEGAKEQLIAAIQNANRNLGEELTTKIFNELMAGD